jgi:hypothetical protein
MGVSAIRIAAVDSSLMSVLLIQLESPSLGTGARTGSWTARRWVKTRRLALSDRMLQQKARYPTKLRIRIPGRWWSCQLGA